MSGKNRNNINVGANSIVYSGRGRPRTKDIVVDRPLPVGIVLSPGSPTTGDLYKNRKIRVGGPFQAKIPKNPLVIRDEATGEIISNNYGSSRPLPEPVSERFPHLTRRQEQEETQTTQLAAAAAAEGSIHSSSAMDIGTTEWTAATKDNNNGGNTTSSSISPGSIKSGTSRSQKTGSDRGQDDDNMNDNEDGDDEDDDDGEDYFSTKRGGLVLCPPDSEASEDYWKFVEPLFLHIDNSLVRHVRCSTVSDPSSKTSCSDSKTWQSQILQWHLDKEQRKQQMKQQQVELEAQLPKKRGRKPKRKKETPLPEDDDDQDAFGWYTANVMNRNNNAMQEPPTKKSRIEYLEGAHEERAQAMQHLWLRHNGHEGAAKLEIMVQLSAGKATLARRLKKHKRLKYPSSFKEKTPWRLQIEQSILGNQALGFNDLTNKAESRYPYPSAEDGDMNNNKLGSMSFSGYSEENDLEVQKEIWKAILALGSSMEEQLNNASANTSTGGSNDSSLPKLSTVVSFLNHAYQVRPIPEDLFRAPSVPPEINGCLNNITQHTEKARNMQAELVDLLYDTNHGGVDMEALQKLMEKIGRSLSIQLDEAEELNHQLELVADWQKRLDALVDDTELCLSSLEHLAQEGRTFAFRSKSLVQLEHRIHKAYLLRDRIDEWKKSCMQDEEDLEDKKESVKFVAAMVRDANKLKFSFPEVTELLETHRSIEAWIDRASIAIRSRISLTEIKTLIEMGDDLPVDLSDFMEKLRARVCLAEEWIEQFKQFVPCPEGFTAAENSGSNNLMLHWMLKMRETLQDGIRMELHELASEGSRIPVEVDCVKLLQVEIDAKNWTAKAKKWIPGLAREADEITCKRGKIGDLREHLEKAEALREKLVLSEEAKAAWVLDGEKEMAAIVEAADSWYEKYKPYLDWDNRRSEGRSCLSMETLRTIVEEASAIHANIGSGTAKMTRILGQAEDWMKAHETVLARCNIIKKEDHPQAMTDSSYVTIEAMKAAVEAAASDVSLDLDEAMSVKKLVNQVKDWFERVSNAAPKRSKRQGRGRKAKFSVDDIIGLIDEASDLPVNTTEDVNRLQIQLSAVQEWRAKARQDLENISFGFQKLREVVNEVYGLPSDYSRSQSDKPGCTEDSETGDVSMTEREEDIGEEKKVMEDISVCEETSSTAGSEQDGGLSYLGNGSCNVNQLIKAYRKEAKSFGVVSGEVEAADQLDKISNWCVRSLKYLDTQRDIFDKRFFGAFDRFVSEGRDLVASSEEDDSGAAINIDDKEFAAKLNATWKAFISDQLQRLATLVADRERYISWCDKSEEVLSDDKKRPTLDKLKDLTDQSRDFPSVCDMVQKVRGLYYKATEWVKETGKILTGDEKLSRLEAKSIMEQGENLGFVCEELKTLRNAHRAAKSWASRVKKCKIDDGATNANEVQDLLDEHDSLLIEMPEEVSRLQSTMTNYCLCRRPYSGFMIGCDECDEWYHGCCVGISESKADRVDKYVCIRCCSTRVLKNSAKDVVGIIRKWTSRKDFKKARQVEAQKHQRKVRKETKDIEKLQAEIDTLTAQVQQAESAQSSDAMENAVPEDEQPTTAAENAVPEDEPTKTAVENAVPAVEPAAENAVPADEPTNTAENASLVGEPSQTMEGDSKEISQSKESSEQSTETVSPAPAPAPTPSISPEKAKLKIEKLTASIGQSQERLSVLNRKAEEHKLILQLEDSKAPLLRDWCLRVRTMVLFPRSAEDAKNGCPKKDGSVSENMQFLIDQAKQLEIDQINDVDTVINAFGCMAWGILATATLAKKSTFKEFDLLVSRAESLKFPDEKAIRTVRLIHSRGLAWKAKVLKALAPSPGTAKPFDVDALKELEDGADDIPVRFAEESLLSAAIEEKGERHCLCGGPSDARFMLCCDKCENWFHGMCVGVKKEEVTEDTHWICPPCNGTSFTDDLSSSAIVWDEVDDLKHRGKTHAEVNRSPEAPDVAKMWPPFGLLGSNSCLEALGEECSALPDVTESVQEPQYVHPPVAEPRDEVMGANSPLISDPILRMHVANAQALAAQTVSIRSASQGFEASASVINKVEPQAYPWVALLSAGQDHTTPIAQKEASDVQDSPPPEIKQEQIAPSNELPEIQTTEVESEREDVKPSQTMEADPTPSQVSERHTAETEHVHTQDSLQEDSKRSNSEAPGGQPTAMEVEADNSNSQEPLGTEPESQPVEMEVESANAVCQEPSQEEESAPSNGLPSKQATQMEMTYEGLERAMNGVVRSEHQAAKEYPRPHLSWNSQLSSTNSFHNVSPAEMSDKSTLCAASGAATVTESSNGSSTTQNAYKAASVLQNGVAHDQEVPAHSAPRSQSPSQISAVAMDVVMAPPLPVQENGR